ncbi:MAG: peptide chain release factor 3 [Flavobacteriales bacterium]
MNRTEEIKRRRTFAIISHPDAGKTTLTEKLLLYGGAINVAGAVKSNKIKQGTTSDFMEIERQRGISVATSVMGFDYNGFKINILDTPGHRDFAEDTYRTLTAADSVIVVIDVAKGVEAQTERLVEVCRMRKTPMMIFINKLDRMGKDAFELLDEIEEKLKVNVRPLSWPIGMGKELKGVYNLYEKKLQVYTANSTQRSDDKISIENIMEDSLLEVLDEEASETLREEVELVDSVYPKFSREDYLQAEICPVFFGSAINTFGVQELLNCFTEIAPEPLPKQAEERLVLPEEEEFTGFIFKIHANLDPKHRNRIAFVKVVSGTFKRNTNYKHIRLNKNLKFSSPTAFMAAKKDIVEEAFPGDIVGLPDSGNFKIGDTLTSGENLNYKGIPSFAPELFNYIENADPMKAKQLEKGIDQLMDEGVAQLFIRKSNNRKIIGTVGALQFDVIQHRLKHEYNATCRFETISLHKACWVSSENDKEFEEFKKQKQRVMAVDKYGRDVFLADSAFTIQMAEQKFPSIQFHYTSEWD